MKLEKHQKMKNVTKMLQIMDVISELRFGH